jgi:hypothetical protein
MESSGYPMTVHISDACAHNMTAAAAAADAAGEPQDAGAVAGSVEQLRLDGSSGGSLPWDLLDMGVRHVKGKGWMRSHLLKVRIYRFLALSCRELAAMFVFVCLRKGGVCTVLWYVYRFYRVQDSYRFGTACIPSICDSMQ